MDPTNIDHIPPALRLRIVREYHATPDDDNDLYCLGLDAYQGGPWGDWRARAEAAAEEAAKVPGGLWEARGRGVAVYNAVAANVFPPSIVVDAARPSTPGNPDNGSSSAPVSPTATKEAPPAG